MSAFDLSSIAKVPVSEERASALTIAQLVSSGAPLEWFEAVAIVQGLCQLILESGDSIGPASLSASDVWITSLGRVEADTTGPRSARTAIQRIGQMLSELLPGEGVPVGLTSLVWKALDNPPGYASLTEFSEALAYFERPNRALLIEDVYHRAQSMPPVPVQPKPVLAPVNAAPAPAEPEPANIAKKSEGFPTKAVALVVGVVLIVAMGVWGVVQVTLAPPGAGIRSWLGSGPTANTSSVPDAASRPATSRPVAIGPELPAGRQSIKAERQRSPATEDTKKAAVAESEKLPEPEHDIAGSTTSPPDQPERASSEVSNSSVQPPKLLVPGGSQTFGASDADVTPPRPIAQQRLGTLPSFVLPQDVVRIAVLISEDGMVESVKAESRPRSIGESLLLMMGMSVAKSWRFYPAVKDGRPVPYRALVALAAH